MFREEGREQLALENPSVPKIIKEYNHQIDNISCSRVQLFTQID